MVYFMLSLSMLRKKSLFRPQNMLMICLHIKKGPLTKAAIQRCSENMQQIYRRTPMQKYDFNKVAKQLGLCSAYA